MQSTGDFHGVRVVGGRNGRKRIGKILRAVLRPDDFAVVGYLVARPDFLFMFKRKDRFLAFDAFKVVDGRVVGTTDRDSWDEPACRRLDIDWDTCLIVEGMELVTRDGEKVGTIDSVEYDGGTGETRFFRVGDGMAATALLGVASIPVELIVGYRDGRIVAQSAASDFQAEGGFAAKAGEQVALATNVVIEKTEAARKTASKISKNAGKVAGEALDSGSKALGKQLGRTKGMFKSFKDEYKKASAKTPSKTLAKKPSGAASKNQPKTSSKKESPKD